MATWITHLRLAEMLKSAGLNVELDSLLIGSIAPDAGVPNADASGYEPPKPVTHWHDDAGCIDADAYAERYLGDARLTEAARSFHIGYYLHLLTDDAWARSIWRPKKQTPLYRKALANVQTHMHEIKRDWDGLDFLYLQGHPECAFYSRFRYLSEVPDYLDFLPPGLLTQTVAKVQAYYRIPGFDLQRPYHYLSQAEIDAFLEMMAEDARTVCRRKGWMR